MPSVEWKLAAAAARRAAAAAAGSSSASAAAAARSAAAAARSQDGSDAVKHPPSRYHLIRDPSTAAPPRPPIPPEFNDEEAYLPADQMYPYGRTLPPCSLNSWRTAGALFNMDMRSDKKGMPFEMKDLESEDTLWALYDRWLSYFNLKRSSVERGHRFKIFKEKVDLICKIRSDDLELNHLCDVRLDELCPPKRFRRCR